MVFDFLFYHCPYCKAKVHLFDLILIMVSKGLRIACPRCKKPVKFHIQFNIEKTLSENNE